MFVFNHINPLNFHPHIYMYGFNHINPLNIHIHVCMDITPCSWATPVCPHPSATKGLLSQMEAGFFRLSWYSSGKNQVLGVFWQKSSVNIYKRFKLQARAQGETSVEERSSCPGNVSSTLKIALTKFDKPSQLFDYPSFLFLIFFDQGWNEVCCLSLPAELFKFWPDQAFDLSKKSNHTLRIIHQEIRPAV